MAAADLQTATTRPFTARPERWTSTNGVRSTSDLINYPMAIDCNRQLSIAIAGGFLSDRITHFGGINRTSARHLARKEDERRTDAGAELFGCGNMQTSTGAARKREGLSVEVHFPNSTLVWPDILGNFRPHTGKRWNFCFGNIFANDFDYEIGIWEDGGTGGGGGGERDADNNRPIEEQWRYRNMVRTLDARLRYLNLAESGLPRDKQDLDITYENINSARAVLEGLIPNGFVSHRIKESVYPNYDDQSGVQRYADFAEVLTAANAGAIQEDAVDYFPGHTPEELQPLTDTQGTVGVRTWRNMFFWMSPRIDPGTNDFMNSMSRSNWDFDICISDIESVIREYTRILFSVKGRVGHSWVMHVPFAGYAGQASAISQIAGRPKQNEKFKIYVAWLYKGHDLNWTPAAHPEWYVNCAYITQNGSENNDWTPELYNIEVGKNYEITSNGIPMIGRGRRYWWNFYNPSADEWIVDESNWANILVDVYIDKTFTEDALLGKSVVREF